MNFSRDGLDLVVIDKVSTWEKKLSRIRKAVEAFGGDIGGQQWPATFHTTARRCGTTAHWGARHPLAYCGAGLACRVGHEKAGVGRNAGELLYSRECHPQG
jgi:hypothetical protein